MPKNDKISASMEDYLEAIYIAIEKNGAAKAKDISQSLQVKAGSVTGALQNLQKSGYINYAPYELITLTDAGLMRARSIFRKHKVLKEFFVNILGADQELADSAACKIEHDMGDELIDRLVCFTEKIQSKSSELIEKIKEEYNKEFILN